jgi:hypothetical protein
VILFKVIVSIWQMDHKLHKCIMNSPFNLVHIKRDRLIEYATLRNIRVYSMIKQLTDVIKRTTYALDKLEIGESSKYATLAMKATILDKDDITLTRWINLK